MSCLKDENDQYIHNKQDVLQYIEQYFTDLYSPKQSPRYDPEWTQYLETRVEQYTNNREHEDLTINLPIQPKEVQEVISSLPNNKTPGPDSIPYEFLKNGGPGMEQSLFNVVSSVFDQEIIPSQWQQSTTTCIPKGKKNPEYLSNKRALTLASNVAKVFERVMVNRVSKVLPFTEAQAGARKGRSTADQVFILKHVLRSRKAANQPTYLAFLDIKQAYDQVWKAAVLTTLWERGVRGKMWRILKLLNTNLTTQIATRFGLTKEIQIQESLRQGGVASGLEFAAMMDTAEECLQEEQLGVLLEGILIASLILMDDVVLIAPSPKILQKMLNVLDRVALKWHLTFNQIKSKVMIVNGPPSPSSHQWTLGNLILEECTTYTYLGEVIAASLSLQEHIKHMRARSMLVTSTMFSVAEDNVLGKIKMQTFMQLYESCWVHAVMYNAETWTATKAEVANIEHIQLTLLRRFLKVPTSTPKAAIFADLGIQPLHFKMHAQQLMLLHKLLNAENLASHVLRSQYTSPYSESWLKSAIEPILQQYKLPTEPRQIQAYTKQMWKNHVSKAIHNAFTLWFTCEAAKSTKMLNVARHKNKPTREPYILSLTRNQVAAIFRLRFGMTTQEGNR